MVGGRKRPASALLVAIALAGVPASAGAERTLFLDRCTGGCQYTPGVDDARTNHSSLIGQASTLSGFSYGDASWEAVVDCVRDTFASFAITVTDHDPGVREHLEVAIAGTPQELGLPAGVLNVSPITCDGDRVVDNGIGFAFATELGDLPLDVCWMAAQAAGTLLGLDREFVSGDVMTALAGPLPKVFLDEEAACGEFAPRSCTCGGDTQNSYQHLRTLLPEPAASASGGAAVLVLAGLARRRRSVASRAPASARAARRARRARSRAR